MQQVSKFLLAVAAASALGVAGKAQAIVIDGTLDGGASGYGSPLATQTINTAFGDSTAGDGTSSGGSELDAAYGVESGGNLNVFLSGNFESNGNRVNVFLADGRAGQNTLAAPATGTLQAMNGSVFSPGFQATYALDVNDYQGTTYIEEYDLTGATAGGYVGNFALTNGIGSGSPGGSITYGLNDTNAAGVNGSSGTAADPTAANAVTTGLEISIPLSLLGNPVGPVEVLADINGGSDGYESQQFLPGLPVGTGNLGGGGTYAGALNTSSGNYQGFNFSNLPNEYFTVPGVATTPEPASLGLLGGLATLLAGRRRRV